MKLFSLRASAVIIFSVVFISGSAMKAYAADITVTAPLNSTTVPASFLLHASAPTCVGQNTASMAYSFDSNTDNILSGATSINQMVTDTAGSHLLRVKAWGNSGAFCEVDLNVIISSQSVVVSTPSNNATVATTFPLQAQAAACSGASTSSMAYSFDNNADNILSGQQSINQNVTAPSSGAHILRVKAWNVNGALCDTDVSITVNPNNTGLVPGSTANAYSRIELLNNYTGSYGSCPPGSAGSGVGGATGNSFQLWLTQPDCGTVGNKSGNTSLVSPPATPPSNDTQVRQYTMSYDGSNGAGVRWFIPLSDSSVSANDDVYLNFQYDIWVYFDQTSIDKLFNLELDLNQTVGKPAQNLYIYGTQCNMVAGVWQVYKSGTGWSSTGQSCSRSLFQPGWHHVQIQFHRNSGSASLTYDAEAIDGTVQNFTCGGGACTFSVGSGTNWGANVLGPNFQLDGISGGSSISGYADQFTIYRW